VKPAPFDYYAPQSLAEALGLLTKFGEAAKPLAGGQSLVPMMNFRLARPAHVVDLNRLRELNYLKTENGELRIGAMTRQRALERSAGVFGGWPLLEQATRHIGHVHIRNRGTVGGSLAHAFPCAELPVAMTALGASFVLRSEHAERVVAAKDFFVDVMTTLLQPGELLVEIRVPQARARSGSSFQEISRRHGDFALAGAAGVVVLQPDGTIGQVDLVFAGATPLQSSKTATLIGQRPDTARFKEVASVAATELDCSSDIHASAEYRREASKALARRVLEQAAARAAGSNVR
jgi:CO/xanthine dehydrogenase FAD-binding subunit